MGSLVSRSCCSISADVFKEPGIKASSKRPRNCNRFLLPSFMKGIIGADHFANVNPLVDIMETSSVRPA
jgi:hypothetical protein